MTLNNNIPAFNWTEWYEGVGGRTINIPDVERIMGEIRNKQAQRFNGPVSSQKKIFNSSKEAAKHIKSKAKEFGADLVGICEIESSDLYEGKTTNEKYAISIGGKMLYTSFTNVPSNQSAIECVEVYHRLGEVVINLANYIRSLGYTCEVEHPVGDSNLLHIPVALKAGLGELGRHGSIINPELGPLFRLGSVTTSIPMEIDQPIDAGIAAFCDNCKACRIYCPADAIPDERDRFGKKDHLGNYLYRVDTGKCFPYFAKHEYCSACLPTCVYNHKDWATDFEGNKVKKYPHVIMETPPKPFDGVSTEKRHNYPKFNRDNPKQYLPRKKK
ncbi:MAG: reductive dehalogenase domain-containing protein [Vicingaceae bacterium]|nr:reductive dehalogenase domain-containing protein [Vicingaceae bacterium]